MQQVIVEIDADGNVKVGAQGVSGPGCQALTRAIEQALGQASSDKKTAEFYQQEKTNARAGGGTSSGHRP